MNKGNVLIVRTNYRKAYPVMESLKKAGYKVFAGLDSGDTVLLSQTGFSRYIDGRVRIINPNVSEEGYVKSIINATKKLKIDIVCPVGFIDFMLLSKHKDEIEKYAVVPSDTYEKMSAISDKWFVCNIARDVGINYPRSLLLKEKYASNILYEFVNTVGFPLVVKGVGDGSKPLFCSNEGSLLKVLSERAKANILLQEFIIGFGVGYFVLSHHGEVLAEFMHRRIFEQTPLGGASLKACSNFDSELLDLGRRIVKSIRWTGVMMVEFKKEVEKGLLYLLEINPKFWGSLELAYRAGVDFPRYLVEFFLEGRKPEKKPIKNVCFSWTIDTSYYSKYGFKTLIEAFYRVLPRNPLYSDLHLHDPPNLLLNIANISLSLLSSTFTKGELYKNIYLTDEFKIMCSKCDAIIYDLDNTLVKLPILWHKVYGDALKRRLVREASLQEAFYNYSTKKDQDSFYALSNFVEKYEMEAVEKLRKDEYLTQLLGKLKKTGVRVAVISKQTKNVIVKALNKLGILHFVDGIVGREDAVIRVDQLRIALEKIFGKDKADKVTGIMVGDTLIDVKAALQRNMTPCLITHSHIGRAQARELDVSYFDTAISMTNLLLTYRCNMKSFS